jgi:hypothetical protein
LNRRRNDDSVPVRKKSLRCLIIPLEFQENGLSLPSPGLEQNLPPFVVELKPGAIPVSQRQYNIPHKKTN